MPWFMWLQILQCPFLSFPGTQADSTSCALCYTHFYHRGPCCLPLPPGSWLLQSFFLPSPDHAGLSSAEFDAVHLQGLDHPSIPQSLTQSQSKAKAVLRNFRCMRCLGMDKTQRFTYTCCLSYTLCYAPLSLFLKPTTPSVTEALPGTIKAGNERRGNQKEPQGLLGKETLF